MKILFFGDVVGKPGRLAFQQKLQELRTQYQPDFVIVNVDNATHGKSIGWNAYNFFKDLGVDCLTGGNHVFSNPEAIEILTSDDSLLLRSANLPSTPEVSGRGWMVLQKGDLKLGIIQLLGRVFMMDGPDNPFYVVEEILNQDEIKDIPVLVDFHAEATSEKVAMGHYLDGRVTAVVGTHTHIQTADEGILPGGTAHITDVGMCGPLDSVLGVDKKIILKKFLTGIPLKHEVADMPAVINAVVIETNGKLAQSIERLSFRVD